MNIALSAVFLFILLLPPVAFYVSYTFGRQTRGGLKFTFLDGLLASSVFSLFVHSLGVLILRIFGLFPRFDILLKFVGGEIKDLENQFSNKEFSSAFLNFSLYNVSVLGVMITIGAILRYLSKKFEMHASFEALRIYNRWWYIFEGYSYKDKKLEARNFDLVLADVLVDTSSGTMIYSGRLESYVCNGEELERIYLSSAVKRDFKKGNIENGNIIHENEPGESKEIPGDIIMIPEREIKNLNLRFITIEEDITEIENIPNVNPDNID